MLEFNKNLHKPSLLWMSIVLFLHFQCFLSFTQSRVICCMPRPIYSNTRKITICSFVVLSFYRSIQNNQHCRPRRWVCNPNIPEHISKKQIVRIFSHSKFTMRFTWRFTCPVHPQYSKKSFKICIQTKKPISSGAHSNSLNILIVLSLSFDCWHFVFDPPFWNPNEGVFRNISWCLSFWFSCMFNIDRSNARGKKNDPFYFSLSVCLCVFARLQ